jgi:hypothetical protein
MDEYSTSAPRRFPPPWRAERTPGGWQVVDATGRPLAYVYAEDRPGVNNDNLSVDEGRRIAGQIARLPGMLMKG